MDCTRNIQAKNYGSAIGRKRGRQQPAQEENSAWLVTRVFGLIPSPGSAWLPTSRTLAGHAMARMNWPADIKLAHKTLISPPDRFSIHSLRLTSVRIIYHFLSLIHTLIAFFPIFFLFSFSLPALPRRSFSYSRPPGSKQNPTMRFSILYLFICGIGFTHAIAFPKSR